VGESNQAGFLAGSGNTGQRPRGEKAAMIWVRRLMIGSGLVAASFLVATPMAGAIDTYTSTPPAVGSTATTPPSALPFTSEPQATGATGTATQLGSSSLPFTGADIGELAVIGVGAVAAGRLLLVRRRRPAA
jgi:hypothetical protein